MQNCVDYASLVCVCVFKYKHTYTGELCKKLVTGVASEQEK